MGAKKHVAKVGKQVKGLLRSGGRAAAGSPSMDPGRQPSAAGRTVGEPGHPSDVDDTGDQLQLLQAQLAQLAQQNRELAQHVLFQQQQGQQWAAGAAAAAVAAPAPPPLVTVAGTGGRRLAAIPAAGGGPAAAATAESAPPLASPGRLKAGGGVPDAPQVGVYFTAPPPIASPGSGHAHFIGGQQVFLASNGYNSVQGGGPLFLPGSRTPLEHLTFTHPPQHFFPEERSLGSNPLATGAGSGQSAAQGREEKHGHENGNKLRGLEFGTIAGREEQQDDQCSSPGHGITNPAYYNGQHQDRSNENQGGCGSVEEVNSYTSDDVASDNVVSSYDDDEEERCFSPTNNGEDGNSNKEESSSSSSRTFI
uniref:Uncharacterized protein n=1 Tax=Heterosigma akashiwo TaxID=2829 RepID=A0A7S3UWM3_HETAK